MGSGPDRMLARRHAQIVRASRTIALLASTSAAISRGGTAPEGVLLVS